MSTGSGLSELRSDIATGKVALSGSTIADSTLSGANITSGSADLTTLTTTGNANIGTDGGKIGIGGLNNPLDQISFYDNAAGDGFGFYGSDGSLMGNLWLNTGTTRNMFFSTPGVTGENTGGDNFIVMRFNGPSNKLFFGDTGTNSWVQGSHTLNFKAGEGSIGSTTTAPQMTLTTTGSLGIGTTSPQSALTVSSASAQFQISNGVSSMRIGNSGNSIYDIDFDATDNTSSRIIRFFRNANTTGVASIDILRADGTSGSAGRISSNSNSWLNLNSGNVGIGMTTPTYKLDVTGTAHFNSYVDAVNFVATSTTATSTFAGGLTVGTSKFIVDSTTGNVGIGTASPTEKLHISATQPEIVIQDSDSTGNGIVSGIVFKNSSGAQTAFFGDGSTGDSDFYLTNSNSGGIIFSSPGESMRILNSGRVGIGTSSPDGTLQISNNVGSIPSNGAFSVLTLDSTATAAVGTGPSIIFKGQTGNSTARYGFAAIQGAKASASAADYSGYLTFLTQNSGGSNALTEQMRIDGSGSVGIGTTSPSARLSVTGAGQGTTRAFAVADSTNLDRFVILDSGRIGVGTVLPTVLFDIRGTSASGFMRILSTDAATTDVGGSLSLGGNAGSTGATFATISGVKSSVGGDRGHMTFATNGNTGLTEKMRLDYLGNLGIGLTNPGYKLDVVGTASTSADSYFNGVRVGRGNSSIGQNTAVGYGTLNSDSSGDSNTAVGYLALYVNTIGGSNTAVGVSALSGNTEGNWNTANGMKSLQTNTIGSYNTAVGYQALSSNTTGSYNAAVGMYALNSNTTAQNNTALGYFSLGSNNTGTANLAAGKESLYSNVTGNYNTALGYQALYNAGKTVTSGNFVVGIAYTIVTAGNTDFVSEQGAANNNPGTTFTAAVVGTGTGTAASNTNDNLAIGYQ
ncbi:MAG: hypothetical protein NT077_04660, partial [Candidatus Taylorbacteria bacterium]|nr:hypothetical protein [Candidatus Taylorbacteria bacterium]